MDKIDFEFSIAATGRKVTFDFRSLLGELRKIRSEEQAFDFVREMENALFFGMIDDVQDRLDKINSTK
jgi:hypothetical protein